MIVNQTFVFVTVMFVSLLMTLSLGEAISSNRISRMSIRTAANKNMLMSEYSITTNNVDENRKTTTHDMRNIGKHPSLPLLSQRFNVPLNRARRFSSERSQVTTNPDRDHYPRLLSSYNHPGAHKTSNHRSLSEIFNHPSYMIISSKGTSSDNLGKTICPDVPVFVLVAIAATVVYSSFSHFNQAQHQSAGASRSATDNTAWPSLLSHTASDWHLSGRSFSAPTVASGHSLAPLRWGAKSLPPVLHNHALRHSTVCLVSPAVVTIGLAALGSVLVHALVTTFVGRLGTAKLPLIVEIGGGGAHSLTVDTTTAKADVTSPDHLPYSHTTHEPHQPPVYGTSPPHHVTKPVTASGVYPGVEPTTAEYHAPDHALLNLGSG